MTPKFVDTRFAQLIPSLNSGKFDVIASALYITAERAKQVDYIPYLTTGSSIVALIADHNAPSTLAGLCGKRVSIIKGAAVAEDMRKESTGVCRGAKPIDVREYPTDPEATEALLSGHVDVQVTDAAVAKDVVAKNASKLKISSTTLLYPIPVGLAVKKGNAKLESQLKQALAALDKAGTYQSLLQRYNLEPPNQQQVAAILGG
jgi:ABC-type amino acid transport substrate-binding protein